MDVVRDGMLWLADQVRAHSAHEVTISRGIQSVSVQAARGRTMYDVQDVDGVVTRATTTDFLIRAADYPGTPLPGDVIDDDGMRYIVTGIGDHAVYDWCDAYGGMLRVHARRCEG